MSHGSPSRDFSTRRGELLTSIRELHSGQLDHGLTRESVTAFRETADHAEEGRAVQSQRGLPPEFANNRLSMGDGARIPTDGLENGGPLSK